MRVVISYKLFEKFSLEEKNNYLELLKNEKAESEDFLQRVKDNLYRQDEFDLKVYSMFVPIIFGVLGILKLILNTINLGGILMASGIVLILILVLNYILTYNKKNALKKGLNKYQDMIFRISGRIAIIEDFIFLENLLKKNNFSKLEKENISLHLKSLEKEYNKEFDNGLINL